jgi:hypothetical protein
VQLQPEFRGKCLAVLASTPPSQNCSTFAGSADSDATLADSKWIDDTAREIKGIIRSWTQAKEQIPETLSSCLPDAPMVLAKVSEDVIFPSFQKLLGGFIAAAAEVNEAWLMRWAAEGDADYISLKAFFDHVGPWPRSLAQFEDGVSKCLNIVRAFQDMQSTVADESDIDLDFVQKIQSDINSHCLTPFPEKVQQLSPFFADFTLDIGRCPLLSADGAFRRKVANSMNKSAEGTFKPVVDQLEKLRSTIGSDKAYPILHFDFARLQYSELMDVANQVSSQQWEVCTQWATRVGDTALSTQVQFLFNMTSTLSELASCSGFVCETSDPDKMQANHLTRLRTTLSACRTFVSNTGVSFTEIPDGGAKYHLDVFTGKLEVRLVMDAISRRFEELQTVFTRLWTDHLKLLTNQITEGCPGWVLHRESMLANVDIVEKMMRNKDRAAVLPLHNRWPQL